VTEPYISFLSDYGWADDFVGTCHAVIAKLCPNARVIDLTHGIPRHDVRAGALALRSALDYLPDGVVLAVVDPDVGAARRAVALESPAGRVFVGPDNGLLIPAADAAGGVVQAVDIARSTFRLEPVSATFHGRDIFAPVAARLAAGELLATAGDPLDPAELLRLELPRPRLESETLITHVIYIDRFGNVQLDAGHEDLEGSGLRLGREAALELPRGDTATAQYARTFADVSAGEVLVYEDAQRRLAIAVSGGDAAAHLGLGLDDELPIRPL
jgi:S-adenosylmethionine hydrolase